MKLNAVSTNTNRQNNIDKQNNRKNISFRGVADMATVFWNFVDAGGRGLQFTVEDMFGTNFPRTYKGAMAGYEYTGQINWPSVWQEGIREFLTGPTMTLAPIAILAIATKMSGKSAGTHCENITNLSHLATKLKPEEITINKQTMQGLDIDNFREDFLKTVVDDILSNSASDLGQKAKETRTKQLIDGIKKYNSIQDSIKNATSRADKKQLKKEAKKLLETMGNNFESTLKEGNKSFAGVNFQAVKYSMPGTVEPGATNFKNYIKYISAYMEDFAEANLKDVSQGNGLSKKFVELSKNAIESFEETWLGKRITVVASMIVLTGVVMSIIPKLYTLASGGVNPNAASIYNEAQKREGK